MRYDYRSHIAPILTAFAVFLAGVFIIVTANSHRTELSQLERTLAACDTSFFTVSNSAPKSCITDGQQIYDQDNRFAFSVQGSSLANLAYVQTQNVSLKDLNPYEWSVTLQKAATVYLFTRHIPGRSAPDWIANDYTRQSDDDMNNTAQYLVRKNAAGLIGEYDVWTKDFSSGATVPLHAAGDAANVAYSMYIVGLKEIVDATAVPSATAQATATVQPTSHVTAQPTAHTTAQPTAVPTAQPTAPSGGGGVVGTGQSLSGAIKALGSGQTLLVHGGTYNGGLNVTIPSGATVKAYPGERPVVAGLSSITGSNGSVLDGINFTWGSEGYGPHMVHFSGSGWTYINGEVYNAHGYANILITGGASNWRIANCYIHDNTNGGHTDVQDHLIYVSNASNGIIERCIFANSPRGRGIKMGPPNGSGGPKNITVRYSTFYNNLGPSNMQVSGDTSGVKMYRNLLMKSGSSTNITDATNGHSGNSAYENAGDGSGGVAPSSLGAGNVSLTTTFTSDYHPQNPAAAAYGRYAP